VLPVIPEAVAEIVTVPCFNVFALPLASIVVRLASDDDHVTVESARELPSLNVPVAERVWLRPAATEEFCGLMVMAVRLARVGVGDFVSNPPPPQLLSNMRKDAERKSPLTENPLFGPNGAKCNVVSRVEMESKCRPEYIKGISSKVLRLSAEECRGMRMIVAASLLRNRYH
jgi:hypothetical protein